MYKRIFDVESKLDEGMFLFGARQTGKSTLLKERFKGAIYYDLLNPRVRKALKLNPNSIWEALQDKPAGTLVIVDEIQKVPELLDEVQSGIKTEEKSTTEGRPIVSFVYIHNVFVLCATKYYI